jgi:PIN domain nuclease of toxin-antitoxin system
VRLLLDTQVYLWWLADSRRLPAAARAAIRRADIVFISAASVWEAAVKVAIGKLDADIEDLVAGIAASGFAELPIRATHAATLSHLAPHHRDPFDRMLVAQALTEPLRLLTADKTLRRYTELVDLV